MSQQSFADLTSVMSPSSVVYAITPADTENLPRYTKALFVGDAGDVVVRAVDSEEDVTFRNLPAGYILDVRVKAVRATGTTASGLVALC